MDLLQDPIGLIASGRSGLIIVDVIIRRDPAGDQVRFFGSDASVGVEGEGLLKDHGIHITGGGIAAEAEISETISDGLSLISGDALKHMGMMADNQIGSVVDGKLGQGHLIGIGDRIFFISPVEDHKDQIGAFCPYLLDIYPNLVFPFQMVMELVNAYQSDLDAFDLHKSRLVITESCDSGFFQVFLCVSKALISIIVAVVVCHVDSLHAAVCKDFRIFGRSLEGKSLSVSCGGIRESSLKIDYCEVIRIKNRLYILEKISRTVQAFRLVL